MADLSCHPSQKAGPLRLFERVPRLVLPCAKILLSVFFFFLQYQQQTAAARGRIRGPGICYETFWRIGEQLFPHLYTFHQSHF